MTAPVPLAEQPTDAERDLGRAMQAIYLEVPKSVGDDFNAKIRAVFHERAVKTAELRQQHERALAVVEAAQKWAADIRDAGFLAQTAMAGRPKAVRLFNAVVGYFSLAALDGAANTAGDAG